MFASAVLALVALAIAAPTAPAMPNSGDPGGDDGYASALTGQAAAIELVLSTRSVQVSEAGTSATVTVRLASRPDRVVTVTPLADVPAATSDRQVRAVPTSLALEFGPDDWETARSVTITGIDDDQVEASPHLAHVTLAVVGSDTQLLATAQVDVQVDDNDRANVVVTDADGSTHVSEAGESDALEVRLGTRPTSNVAIRFELGSQVVASVPELVFTPQDWSAAQTVRIGASQDRDVEGTHNDTVRFTLATTDPAYASGTATPGAVAVRIDDDEVPGVTLTHTQKDTRLHEGGRPDAYTVQLDARPTSTVRIEVDAGEDVTASPTRLEFSPDSWSQPQNVNLVAVDDEEEERAREKVTISHAIDGDHLWKAVKPPTLMAEVTDDDVAVGDDGTVLGDDGLPVEEGEETSLRRGARATELVDPSLGTGSTGAAGSARTTVASDGSAMTGSDGDRIELPELATRGREATDGAAGTPPKTATAGGATERPGDGPQDRQRVQAEPRNLEEWYSANWKKTVPATGAAALGLGGLMFSLMSDGGVGIGRRRWF